MNQRPARPKEDEFPETIAAALNSRTAALSARVAAPAPVPSVTAAPARETPALRLVVSGFSAIERNLLEGTVKLSQRRQPRLALLAESEVEKADIVMINALDARAMEWAGRQPVLARKAVIWVDGRNAPPGHTLAKRPVQWPILPILLARALEQGPATQSRQNRPVPHPNPEPGMTSTLTSTSTASSEPNPAPMILVVDDSLAVRVHLRTQLEARGFRVVDVENVQTAIEAVTRGAFACVLMDVLMPGADGYEGCRQIKAKLRNLANVPVIMLTSKSSPFDRIRGKMAGCDAYLTKPVDAQQLAETLAQHMARPTGRGTRPEPAAAASTNSAPGAPPPTVARRAFAH